MPDLCEHLRDASAHAPNGTGCEECEASGGSWVALRACQSCGHVGCCDSSPGKHATAHFTQTHHPVMASIEPGQNWRWCYVDQTMG